MISSSGVNSQSLISHTRACAQHSYEAIHTIMVRENSDMAPVYSTKKTPINLHRDHAMV